MKGISTWAGHGNDPLYYSLDVLKEIASYGYEHDGKKTIYIYPEMNHTDKDFWVRNEKSGLSAGGIYGYHKV